MTTERIDVLAVMDAAIARLPDTEAAPLDEARTAVAALFEAHQLKIEYYDGYCLSKPNGEAFSIERHSTEFGAQQEKNAAIAAALAACGVEA